MHVKKNVYNIVEVLCKRITGGMASYMVKTMDSCGSKIVWLRSDEIDQKKLVDFENTLKSLQNSARLKRLQKRNEIKEKENTKRCKKRYCSK